MSDSPADFGVPAGHKRMTTQVMGWLTDIVGAGNLSVAAEVRAQHASDETEDLVFQPEAVAFPRNAQQISEILKLANECLFPVTTRGAGTGLSGGALPVCGGLVLSTKYMNRILEVDRRNLFMVVEPAVTTQQVQDAATEAGLFYPPDPSSKGSCHIGGNVAANSGGPRAVKYGVTKDYVYGLQAVMPNGDIVDTGGKLLKNVSGYNLTQLMVGSEGTLGVLTRVTLKLIPDVKYRKTLLAAFPDEEMAATAVTEIFNARVTPCAVEFMERAAIEVASARLDVAWPNRDAAAQLLIEVDGNFEEAVDADVVAVSEVCERVGATGIILAEDKKKQAELWRLRRSVGEAVKAISAYKEEDTVVPRAELPKLVKGVREITKRAGVRAISYGHAGDGNLHVNILKEGCSDSFWNDELPAVIEDIFRLTVSLGGTISGEHGIGWSQRRYLPIACSPAELAAMKALKTALDPNNILNPDKIFL